MTSEANSAVELFRLRLNRSEAIHPLRDAADVTDALGSAPAVGRHLDEILSRLRTAIEANAGLTATDEFDLPDLRRVENTFWLEAALDPAKPQWAPVLQVVRNGASANLALHPPDNEAWDHILLLARAAIALGYETSADPRIVNLAKAARQMAGRGYELTIEDGRVRYGAGELERATAEVLGYLQVLGHADFLGNLFGFLRRNQYDLDQYLIARRVSTWGQDIGPWLPVGFLLNLAIRTDREGRAGLVTKDQAWKAAVGLATELIATLDLQDYGPWSLLSVQPRRLEPALSRLALGDHLFGLRQWPLRLTAPMSRAFFGAEGQTLDTKVGWGLEDVLPLIEKLVAYADQPDPQTWHRQALLNWLPPHNGEAILAALTHEPGTANQGYTSPLAANADDSRLMFRPFVAVNEDLILIPAMSLVGPAVYEVCIATYGRSFGPTRTNKLRGDGCERLVRHLFASAGLEPSIEAEKYRLGKEVLECDLVVESDTHILLVEMKAKALTRKSMAGWPGAALFDFGRNVLASQLQALRHEGVLRRDGVINFRSGKRLEWKGREIVRLSVSLLDQASLQDRTVLWHLYETFLHARVSVDPNHPDVETVKSLNKSLETLRGEAQRLDELGVPIAVQRFGASLSAPQLATFLEGADDLADLVLQLDSRLTTMSFNPLFELNYYRSSGLLDAARTRRRETAEQQETAQLGDS